VPSDACRRPIWLWSDPSGSVSKVEVQMKVNRRLRHVLIVLAILAGLAALATVAVGPPPASAAGWWAW
jgi:hypothetical protein